MFPCVAMYVWTVRNKGFLSCSDFVGYGNSLSDILIFLLSYTELITLTAVRTLNVKTVTNVTTATFVKNKNAKCKNSTSYVKKKKCHKCEKIQSHKCKILSVINVKTKKGHKCKIPKTTNVKKKKNMGGILS